MSSGGVISNGCQSAISQYFRPGSNNSSSRARSSCRIRTIIVEGDRRPLSKLFAPRLAIIVETCHQPLTMLGVYPCQCQHLAQCLDGVFLVKHPRDHFELDAEICGDILAGSCITGPAAMPDVMRTIVLAERKAAALANLMHLRGVMLDTFSDILIIVDDTMSRAIRLVKPYCVLVVLGLQPNVPERVDQIVGIVRDVVPDPVLLARLRHLALEPCSLHGIVERFFHATRKLRMHVVVAERLILQDIPSLLVRRQADAVLMKQIIEIFLHLLADDHKVRLDDIFRVHPPRKEM